MRVATLPMPSIPPPPSADDDDDALLPPIVPPRRPTVATTRMYSATCDVGGRAAPASVDRDCFDTTSFIVEQTGKCV